MLMRNEDSNKKSSSEEEIGGQYNCQLHCMGLDKYFVDFSSITSRIRFSHSLTRSNILIKQPTVPKTHDAIPIPSIAKPAAADLIIITGPPMHNNIETAMKNHITQK
ncbi:unnamed protein product [Rotaria sp. Silwood1]|nr:unnamed protein product [Rotaria sp. Silwood1]CAF5096360.1 unnamed protein product [Rotaria sp. Silwood1]